MNDLEEDLHNLAQAFDKGHRDAIKCQLRALYVQAARQVQRSAVTLGRTIADAGDEQDHEDDKTVAALILRCLNHRPY